MLMIAVVREAREGSLLVRDSRTGQDVVVFTNRPDCFSRGDVVRIWYNGVMTRSIPPQINAIRVRKISSGRCC